MNKLLATALTCTLSLLASTAQADCDFEDFPRMDSMLLSNIANNVQWNHTPLNARSFRVAASVSAVQDFYAGQWRDAVDFTEFDGWQQILHINEDCMMLVQVKAQNERYSFGRMTLTNPPAKNTGQQTLGQGMPIPPDASVISDMRSDDQIRQGRMVLLLNEDNMHATRAWYESQMLNQGWHLDHRSLQQNANVLTFSKGRELMTVGLLRHADKTQILLNLMDR